MSGRESLRRRADKEARQLDQAAEGAGEPQPWFLQKGAGKGKGGGAKRGRKAIYAKADTVLPCFTEMQLGALELLEGGYAEASKRTRDSALAAFAAFAAAYAVERPEMVKRPAFAGDLAASCHN